MNSIVCLPPGQSRAEAKFEEIKSGKGKGARTACLYRNPCRLSSHESGLLSRTLDPIGCLRHPVDPCDRRPTELPAGFSDSVSGPQHPGKAPGVHRDVE
jgi:hypothetical protein